MTNVVLNLSPSRQITFALLFVHALSLMCLSIYTCELVIKLSLSLLILCHAYHTCRHYGILVDKSSIHTIELNTRNEWLLFQKNRFIKAQLLGNSFITGYLIVLNFKTDAFLNTSVLLTRDSIDAEQWRKLRVYLTIS